MDTTEVADTLRSAALCADIGDWTQAIYLARRASDIMASHEHGFEVEIAYSSTEGEIRVIRDEFQAPNELLALSYAEDSVRNRADYQVGTRVYSALVTEGDKVLEAQGQ